MKKIYNSPQINTTSIDEEDLMATESLAIENEKVDASLGEAKENDKSWKNYNVWDD